MNGIETEEEKRKRINDYLLGKFQPTIEPPSLSTGPYAVDVSNSTTTARGAYNPPPMAESELDKPFAPIDLGDIPAPASDLELPEVPKPVTRSLTEADTKKEDSMADALASMTARENPYKDEERQRIATGSNIMGAVGMALGGIGEGLSGPGRNYLALTTKLAQDRRENAMAEFDRAKKAYDEEPLYKSDSPESRIYQRIAGELLGVSPDKFAKMTATQIAQVLPAVEKLYSQQTKRKESEADIALKQALFGQKQGEAEAKKAEESKKLAVPGWVSTGQVAVDETEAKKLREGLSEYETFKGIIKEYKDMIKKYGTTEVFNRNVASQMAAMAKNLQLKVKNLGQLGVLSASDIPFIEEQVPGPGVFKTGQGMLGALEATEKMSQRSHENQMKARGYQRPGGATTPAPTAEGAAAPSVAMPEDEKRAALQWAMTNKDDPRAKRILKALGVD